MGKTKSFKKQSSTVSVRAAWEALKTHGFSAENPDSSNPQIRTSRRHDAKKAYSIFGEFADVSLGGRQVTVRGLHLTTKEPTSFELPVEGMLGHGALQALYQKTGLRL